MGVGEGSDWFRNVLVLPRPLACTGLAVAGGRVADRSRRVVRGVPSMPAHMGGADCLPGGPSSIPGRGVGCVSSGGVSRDRGHAGLAHANLAAHPGPRGFHGFSRSVIVWMVRLEEGQYALGAFAGPLGQEPAVSLAPSAYGVTFVHAFKHVAW